MEDLGGRTGIAGIRNGDAGGPRFDNLAYPLAARSAPLAQADRAPSSRDPDSPQSPIRVAIVANHPIARVGLRVLLNELPAASVVHEMAVGEGSGEEPGNDEPCWDSIDVVIIDAVSRPAAHFDFTCRLQRRYEHLKLVVVVDDDDGRGLAELIERGIDGILTADDLANGLARAVQQVAVGQRVVSLGTIVRYVRWRPGGDNVQENGPELTADELRILHMVAAGLRNREIALQEFVSEPTVKRRTQKIYRKLQARDRAHAVSLATRRGIL